MKYIEHKKDSTLRRRGKKSLWNTKIYITFAKAKYNPQNTSILICIGEELCRELSLENGSMISFFFSEEIPENWMITKCKSQNGYKGTKTGRFLRFKFIFRVPLKLKESEFSQHNIFDYYVEQGKLHMNYIANG